MIQAIIENLWTAVECLEMFEKIFPLVEQKEADDKTVLVSYTGKGNYDTLPNNFDNYNGLAYFRLIADVDIENTPNLLRACEINVNAKYSIRLVATKLKDQLPNDCAFSDDGLAWLLAKELTGRGGTLKQALGASTVMISATKISTDRKKIIADELPGNDLNDINYQYAYVALDFLVDIEIRQSCIEAICDSYYTTTANTCSPRVCVPSETEKFKIIDTVPDQNSYVVNIPSGSTLTRFQLQNLVGASNDATLTDLTATTSTWTLTNTDNFIIDQVYKLIIFYT